MRQNWTHSTAADLRKAAKRGILICVRIILRRQRTGGDLAQPRYAPADRLLTLVLALQSSRVGLSMSELRQQLGVGRRTVERLLARLRERGDLDLIDESEPGGGKRWRLRQQLPLALDVTTGELAALHMAVQQLEQSAARPHAEALRGLTGKVNTAMDGRRRAASQNDALELAAAEGLVVRPGPRERIDPRVLTTLRDAMLACRKVRLDYRYRSSGKLGQDTVRPYGFLYGTRGYLIAHSENEWANDVRQFVLANIEAVTPLDATFRKPRGWTLAKYAEQAFGAFVEKPVNVEWRFSPMVADEASQWAFHPTQRMHRARDGSLVVRFRAGGLLEMSWHLVTWGKDVVVTRPRKLRMLLHETAPKVAECNGTSSPRAPRSTVARLRRT